jgi:hypothetical protein
MARVGKMWTCPYTKLLALRGDTSVLVDQICVVRDDSVTTVLGDDTDRYNNGKPPAIALGLKEVHIARGLRNLLLYTEGFFDFTVLELDG